MDISAIKAADVATVEILHPVSGEEIGITFDVYGTDSATYRKAVAEIAQRRMNKRQKATSIEAQEQETVELLAICTAGWSGLEIDGKKPKFSIEAAKEIYADERFRWLREQINVAIAERSRFFGNA